jgi:hypothetical protein
VWTAGRRDKPVEGLASQREETPDSPFNDPVHLIPYLGDDHVGIHAPSERSERRVRIPRNWFFPRMTRRHLDGDEEVLARMAWGW